MQNGSAISGWFLSLTVVSQWFRDFVIKWDSNEKKRWKWRVVQEKNNNALFYLSWFFFSANAAITCCLNEWPRILFLKRVGAIESDFLSEWSVNETGVVEGLSVSLSRSLEWNGAIVALIALGIQLLKGCLGNDDAEWNKKERYRTINMDMDRSHAYIIWKK